MQINIQPNGQETTVQLIGQLDTIATTEQADELQQVLDIADKALVIDCSELEYISSAGLRFFMRLKRETEAKGGKIRIINMNEDVADIFRMSGFRNIFTIE
jgi:anti-anti-sigma factor